MAKDDAPKFDPRFDPAFQRGFKAGRRPASASASGASGSVADRSAKQSAADRPGSPRAEARVTAQLPVDRPAPQTVIEPAGIVSPLSPVVTGAQGAPADPDLDFDGADYRSRANSDSLDSYSEIRGGITEPAPEARNPYFIALWIVGVALTVGGLAMLAASVYALVASSPIVAYDRTMDELGIYISTPLMTVGLATVVALLVIAGLRRQR